MEDADIKQMQEQNEAFRTKLADRDAEIQRLTLDLDATTKGAGERARVDAEAIDRLTTQKSAVESQLKEAKADLRTVFTDINNSVVAMIHKHQGG